MKLNYNNSNLDLKEIIKLANSWKKINSNLYNINPQMRNDYNYIVLGKKTETDSSSINLSNSDDFDMISKKIENFLRIWDGKAYSIKESEFANDLKILKKECRNLKNSNQFSNSPEFQFSQNKNALFNKINNFGNSSYIKTNSNNKQILIIVIAIIALLMVFALFILFYFLNLRNY